MVGRRVWLTRIVAVFVVGLLAFFAMGYLGHSSRVRVKVDNTYGFSINAFAQLNATGLTIRSSGDFTIPPHSAQVITWYVHPGSYEAYVNWGKTYHLNTTKPMTGSPPYYDWEEFSLKPFATKNFVVEVVTGSW